jgi:DNA mismatch endonuclease (patch repair protein)
MVLVGRKAAIFVDGCFWHKCPYHFVYPKTRANFWMDKINGNVERDRRAEESLCARGWFVIRIWEHEIKDSLDDCVQRVSRMLEQKDSV